MIERRVTAWHEAGHVIAVLVSKLFGVGDPAIDLRPSSRGKAFAGAKRLFLSPRVTDAEARELVKIAFSGRVGEERLRRISQSEGRLIHPNLAGASGDFAFADQVLAAHNLNSEREELRRQAEDTIADNGHALFKLAQGLWGSESDVLRRDALIAIPEIAQIAAQNPKVAPLPTTPPASPPSAGVPDVASSATSQAALPPSPEAASASEKLEASCISDLSQGPTLVAGRR